MIVDSADKNEPGRNLPEIYLMWIMCNMQLKILIMVSVYYIHLLQVFVEKTLLIAFGWLTIDYSRDQSASHHDGLGWNMTGRNVLWLDLNFVTLCLSGRNDVNGRLCGVQTSGGMTAPALQPQLTVLSHKPWKAWLALSRFWNEIDWQFSDPRSLWLTQYGWTLFADALEGSIVPSTVEL